MPSLAESCLLDYWRSCEADGFLTDTVYLTIVQSFLLGSGLETQDMEAEVEHHCHMANFSDFWVYCHNSSAREARTN